MKITESRRAASSQKFLNNMSQLLNSLALWASTSSTDIVVTKEQEMKEEQSLTDSMEKLQSVSCSLYVE